MKGAVSLPLMGIMIIEFSTEDISGCFFFLCVCVCNKCFVIQEEETWTACKIPHKNLNCPQLLKKHFCPEFKVARVVTFYLFGRSINQNHEQTIPGNLLGNRRLWFSHQVVKILNATDEHVMALGANFSLEADSHLVCMQSEQGYKTQAINIQNQARKGTYWSRWKMQPGSLAQVYMVYFFNVTSIILVFFSNWSKLYCLQWGAKAKQSVHGKSQHCGRFVTCPLHWTLYWCVFSSLFSQHFLRCCQGEFV